MNNQIEKESVYEIMIRMFLIVFVVGVSILILFPFVHILLWGLILCIAFKPLHLWLSKKLGQKHKLASTLLVIISLAIIIIPSWLLFDSIISSVKELKASHLAGTLTIPPPSEKVKTWPLIGGKIYDSWLAASHDLKQFIIEYKDQLAGILKKLASGVLSTASGILQMVGAVIIAGILLVVKGMDESIRKFFRKAAGKRGDEFADILEITVGNVVKGILGVALIQSTLIGIGLYLAGIPFAGLWTLLIFIFSTLQIPPPIIVIPVVIYMFSIKDTTPAVLWTIYLMLGAFSDNILKPILLGKGAPVPTLIIFIGVVGGFIISGFIGLFTGAIIMSLGYKLFSSWMNSPKAELQE